MNAFYKKAWNVLFLLLYPFITLFSLLFIGVLTVVSALSRLFTKSVGQGEETTTTESGWQPFMHHHGLYLSRKAVHEVQFGPVLYHFNTNPPIASLEGAYWSDFIVPIGEGFLLQRWPSIAEHELETFELVYIRPGLEEPFVLTTMPTFYWQTREISHEQVEIKWNEREEEQSLMIDEEQLP